MSQEMTTIKVKRKLKPPDTSHRLNLTMKLRSRDDDNKSPTETETAENVESTHFNHHDNAFTHLKESDFKNFFDDKEEEAWLSPKSMAMAQEIIKVQGKEVFDKKQNRKWVEFFAEKVELNEHADGQTMVVTTPDGSSLVITVTGNEINSEHQWFNVIGFVTGIGRVKGYDVIPLNSHNMLNTLSPRKELDKAKVEEAMKEFGIKVDGKQLLDDTMLGLFVTFVGTAIDIETKSVDGTTMDVLTFDGTKVKLLFPQHSIDLNTVWLSIVGKLVEKGKIEVTSLKWLSENQMEMMKRNWQPKKLYY